MSNLQYGIELTKYEYSVLMSNYLISICCANQLKSAKIFKMGLSFIDVAGH